MVTAKAVTINQGVLPRSELARVFAPSRKQAKRQTTAAMFVASGRQDGDAQQPGRRNASGFGGWDPARQDRKTVLGIAGIGELLPVEEEVLRRCRPGKLDWEGWLWGCGRRPSRRHGVENPPAGAGGIRRNPPGPQRPWRSPTLGGSRGQRGVAMGLG